ncbi:MAG: hypothetical protein ACJ0RA_03545 [Candidatus Neomarinimicrobiota bacterium]
MKIDNTRDVWVSIGKKSQGMGCLYGIVLFSLIILFGESLRLNLPFLYLFFPLIYILLYFSVSFFVGYIRNMSTHMGVLILMWMEHTSSISNEPPHENPLIMFGRKYIDNFRWDYVNSDLSKEYRYYEFYNPSILNYYEFLSFIFYLLLVSLGFFMVYKKILKEETEGSL